MTDYASVGAARVRYCHCHDEPTSFEPIQVVENKNPARMSSGAGTFARAVIGSLQGRFAQKPMLVGGDPLAAIFGRNGVRPDLIGRRGTRPDLIGGVDLVGRGGVDLIGRNGVRPDLIGGIGVTQGTPMGIAVGARGELIMNPLNAHTVTRFGAETVDNSPLGQVKSKLGALDDSLRPFAAVAGFAAGVLGTWMIMDAVQATKDTAKFNAAGAPAGDRSRRGRRRRRWF